MTYDEALETADRHLVFKNGIKEIAAQEGRAATFMAKWTMEDVGSSCHVHTSLWDRESGDALMADESHPSGLSTLGAALPGRPALRGAPAGLAGRTDGQLLPALHAGQLGPHRGGVGRGQPHLRLPGGGPRGGTPGGVPGAGRRREPLPRAGRRAGGRPLRHRPRARARRAVPPQRLRGDRRDPHPLHA